MQSKTLEQDRSDASHATVLPARDASKSKTSGCLRKLDRPPYSLGSGRHVEVLHSERT
jgi:hypothetical protein